MKRSICLMAIISCILVPETFCGTVYAITKLQRPIYEETLLEIGYKSVDEALKSFEYQSNQSLKLPVKVPPLTFTHHLGRFEKSNRS